MLSERVKLKDYICRVCFYPPTHMMCQIGLVVMSGKNSLVS